MCPNFHHKKYYIAIIMPRRIRVGPHFWCDKMGQGSFHQRFISISEIGNIIRLGRKTRKVHT